MFDLELAWMVGGRVEEGLLISPSTPSPPLVKISFSPPLQENTDHSLAKTHAYSVGYKTMAKACWMNITEFPYPVWHSIL